MFGMPRFFKDMPPRKAGRWVAVVISTSPFRRDREIFCRSVTGLRRAYVLARLVAWFEDFTTPYCDGEIGINWSVREYKDN